MSDAKNRQDIFVDPEREDVTRSGYRDLSIALNGAGAPGLRKLLQEVDAFLDAVEHALGAARGLPGYVRAI